MTDLLSEALRSARLTLSSVIFGRIAAVTRSIVEKRKSVLYPVRKPKAALLKRIAGSACADLAPDRRRAVAATFKQEGAAPLGALNRVVLLCYWRLANCTAVAS